jgi:hypothetical protein
MELVKNGQNCKLSDFEDAIGQAETKLWTSLISIYIDIGKETGDGKMIQAHQDVGEIPDVIIPKSYRPILPGWLKFHDGQDFSLVSSTLGLDNDDQLKKLEKWLEDNKVLQVADKRFRYRIVKPIPSMDEDPDAQLVEGVALSSCADVVAAWFSSPIVETDGNEYVLRPLFDERKKKLAKQFLDYLIEVGVVKDSAITFPSAKKERSREEMKQDLDKIKSGIDSLYGWNRLTELFYGTDEKVEEKKEDVKAISTLEQSIKGLMLPPTVSSLVVPVANEVSTALNNLDEINRQRQEANALKEKKEKLSTELMQAISIHLGQLKTLAQVKSSFCSLHAALPPPEDDLSTPTDEIHQFNNQHLDRVLKVDEHVSRWDWRVGAVALFGVAQLVGAIAFPFFSGGLVGEGINDLMFAFQCLQSPGSFSLKSYLVDKGKSLALTAVTMGLGAARLVKACGGSLKQAGKMMLRFNGTLKAWYQAGKHVLIQCANIISSSVIGQAVSRFLTWLNKFIMEQVLERIKSSLFNNSFLRPAFTQLKDLMKSLMTAMVKSGKSASEASQIIRQVLNGAKNKLAAGDWFTELRTNASSMASRMMRIFNDSTAGLSNLQGSYVSEYQSHARTQNTQGITAATNAGTVEMAIKMGKTIVDYGQKAAEVVNKINTFTTTCQTVTKLATHGTTYVGDLNSPLQDELRALKMKSQQGQEPTAGQSFGELSKEEAEEFEKFIAETEGEIQSSIMKTTLDTIQTAWLQPMIQLQVERHVSRIGSKLVKKYCPSLLPEGFDNKGDESKNSEGDDDKEIPSEDGWIDEMGNGKPAGPAEMQNAVDAFGFVLEIQDETGQYTKGAEGDKFTYHPDGNPYSDKPVVKMIFTENEDGSKHVSLIMPDGTKHENVPDPSDPPDRCFFNALSKAQGDPSVDQTIQKLKTHAKGNDRARYMNKLGVNQSYQHLQVGAYRKIRNDANTIREDDKLGRTVRITTTRTERKQKRNNKKMKKIKEELNFQPEDVYSHDVSLNSGGVDEVSNISRMKHESNRFLFRKHEMNFENFREYNQQSESPRVITRVITRHYQHSVGEILGMERKGQSPDRYKITGYQYDFCTGPRDNPTNLYSSGFIPNWNGTEANKFFRTARRSPRTGRIDMRTMRQINTRRKASNVPSVKGPLFEELFPNHRQ